MISLVLKAIKYNEIDKYAKEYASMYDYKTDAEKIKLEVEMMKDLREVFENERKVYIEEIRLKWYQIAVVFGAGIGIGGLIVKAFS